MLARAFEGWHLVIIALVILILFGSKKLPDAARSFGRSLRIFKAETKGLREDGKDDAADRVDDDPIGHRGDLRADHRADYVPPALPTGRDATAADPAPAADTRREQH
ncbi:MAG: Sec-independent protein translocase subunit TatA [Pseudonocardiales bacterium]